MPNPSWVVLRIVFFGVFVGESASSGGYVQGPGRFLPSVRCGDLGIHPGSGGLDHHQYHEPEATPKKGIVAEQATTYVENIVVPAIREPRNELQAVRRDRCRNE